MQELKRDLRSGTLRVKSRYDKETVSAFSYKGQEISVAELILLNRKFPRNALGKIEEYYKRRKPKRMAKRKKVQDKNAHLKTPEYHRRLRSFVPLINTQARESEAHWHAQQAAYEISSNSQNL